MPTENAQLVTASSASSGFTACPHPVSQWVSSRGWSVVNSWSCWTAPMVHLAGEVVGQLPGGAGDGSQVQTAVVLPVPLPVSGRCPAVPPPHPIGMRL